MKTKAVWVITKAWLAHQKRLWSQGSISTDGANRPHKAFVVANTYHG
jgi:hypothetical protein